VIFEVLLSYVNETLLEMERQREGIF
jgi:hypothetical protein